MYYKSLFFTLCFCCGVVAAQDKTMSTSPDEVMVYLKSAKVTETGKISLTKGKNTLKITGLPNAIDTQSYQIGLTNGATLLSVSPSTNYLKPDEYTTEEQKLLDKKQNLQIENELKQAEITTLNGELKLIEQNQKIGNNESGWTADELVKLANYYAQRTLEIRKQLVNKNQDIELLRKKLADIENQINTSLKDRNANRQEIAIEIESSSAMNATISVTYITPNAGWQPFYDIRAESINKPLDLITKGKVYQNTGKEWNNVKLSVSTYLPKSNQNRPILNPFYVQEAQNLNALQGQVSGLKVQTLSNSYQLRDEAMALDEVVVTEVLSQQFNILYKVNGQQNVSSKNTSQTFILDKQSVEADYVFHTVPKITEDVFLLANIKNWQSLNLMLTEANIYFQNNYVGKTRIDPNYTKDEYPLSLGVEERIVVKRRLLDNLESTKFLSNKKIDNYGYEITIRNNSGANIKLEVLDQIPITQNNKIEIEDVETSGGKLDKDTGSILWTENISNGSGKTLNFSYQLKYPKEMNLQFY